MLIACHNKQSLLTTPVPAREAGQTDVLQLRCDPLPVVRTGFIGLGMRGPGAVNRMMAVEGTEIKAICDLEPYNLERVRKNIAAAGRPDAAEYTGQDGWKALCERDDIDLVYICTDWPTHTPMAVYAMEHGKHVAIEVPAATTVEECWQLVNTAEKTRRHCTMLENCCYDKFEMATLNMA
ncbi:MAG: Gfo/Idh/MocA family oxidoreductase, partial [Prevotellaceae bacterium]|nr:Gfo/Idh/MocA family oxidoreductase [Prevotellaceae bacterium]